MGGGKNTMDRGVKISSVGVQYTMGSRGQDTMSRGFDIPCVGGKNSMGGGGGQYNMGRGFNIVTG